MRAQASETARHVARLRAAHQVLEGGAFFADRLAAPILGESADAVARELSGRPELTRLRLFVAARSRFAEDSLAAALDHGVCQAVVLGAGLDTFGLRNPHAGRGLRVIEIDHPATQQWKRELIDRAGIALPSTLSFADVDFERETLADGLAKGGFDANRPAFFIWLGVVPYLTRHAIFATLSFIAGLPGGEVVFDYPQPLDHHPPARRGAIEAIMARSAALGEPWRSFFDPAGLRAELTAIGFKEIEDLGPHEVAKRYGDGPVPPTGTAGPHLLRARRLSG